MFEAVLLSCIAVGTLYLGRRFYRKPRKTVQKNPPAIVAVERNGVVAAYRREDLPEFKSDMLAPSPGLMVFSDAPIPGPTTGTMGDLKRLAETSGRPLVWESAYAIYVPYTGSFCSDINRDVADFGRLVVPPEQALPHLTQ